MSQLTSPKYIKDIMALNQVHFSKSLGQNFLIDDNIVENIAEGAAIAATDGVLEIGAGIGALTEKLLERARRVVALEIDSALWPILQTHFGTASHFKLVKGDVLKINLAKLIAENFADCQRVLIVANLPYYITTPIIMKILEEQLAVDSLTVMIQREVAERMASPAGNKRYGALSVSVQFYAESTYLFTVPRTVFMPTPAVDSAVIRLDIRPSPPVELRSDELFFKVVKAGFAQRRKTLRNTLSHNLPIAKARLDTICQQLAIDSSIRAEQLSIEDFARLSNAIDSALRIEKETCDGQ